MTRQDWLTLLLAYQGADGSALDPVRIQKGMFLAAQQGVIPPGECYEFRPFHYGPYSGELKADTSRLVAKGLAVATPVQGYTWQRYHLSDAGFEYAKQLLVSVGLSQQRSLFAIKQRITGVSFNNLLRDVYAAYPDFATESVFNG